ncbi:MAG: ATP-binding cassette domain-containing protein [Deltaproteobacteria bacterium]|nr:ATP-binding cassette domain-containing protein [Deltaproteobacteria bacterium]
MIHVQNLVKHYRTHKRPPGLLAALRSLVARRYEVVPALDGISFHIPPGARVGFLGPNGAGKTTALKVLAGLLHPTAGEVRVAGFRPQERQAAFLSSITLVTGQKQQLLWDLPPVETFELNRAIYQIPRAEADGTIAELSTLLQLGDLVQKPTRQLSLGERMKCELVAALLHRPKILFLDEPTIGLDVGMQAAIRRFIKEYNERHGATVLLTSHYMADVAALCPRIVVIDHGRLTYDGGLEELARASRPEKRVTLRLGAPATPEQLARLAGRLVQQGEAQVTLQVPQAELNGTIAAALAELAVVDLTVEDAPLEEILAELFDRPKASPPATAESAR